MVNGKQRFVLIVHNVRSTHNVGSMLRSADGLGVHKVYLTGYTPYPPSEDDERLPHIQAKVGRQIQKTALGAEKSVNWEYSPDLVKVICALKKESYTLAALEQTKTAQNISQFKPASNMAIVVGNEVEGLDSAALKLVDVHLQIPMQGKKESFNVAVAAAIALYQMVIRQ